MMGSLPTFTTVICLISVLAADAEGGKILLLPIPIGSHYMNFERIARSLMARGHDIHAYMNQDCKNTKKLADTGVIVHTYKNDIACYFDNPAVLQEAQDQVLKGINISFLLPSLRESLKKLQSEMHAALGNNDVIRKLGDLDFDLCILDKNIYTTFGEVLPYKLDIPLALFINQFYPFDAGVPGLPSFTPALWTYFTNEMTFIERVSNSLFVVLHELLMSYWPCSISDVVSKYVTEKPFSTLRDVKSSVKLWLINSEIALDYPQVRMPHVVDVGGLSTSPPKPLPRDLQDIADSATNGLIIVSFGTYVHSMPETIIHKFFEVFKQLNQTVVWKFTQIPVETVPSHIHLVNWIPQNDLLAHPNTKLFITHCGGNSQYEALYNRVPMLGFPVIGDQKYNAARLAIKGIGIHLDLLSFTPQELLSAINEILTNDTYKTKIALLSAIFKDRPMNPMETLIYWVEHVLKYGTEHLVSPAIHLPWYAYWCIDLMVFFSLLAGICIACVYIFLRYIFRIFCLAKRQKMKQQ